ncbi:hypothetical protein EPUL_002443, partial [Erysiphe pulchra]
MTFNPNPTGGGSNIFGQNKPLFGEQASQNKPSIFGQISTTSSAATESKTNTSQGLFSRISTSKPETSSTTKSLFSNPTGTATSGLFSLPKTSTGFTFGNSTMTSSTENKPVPSFAPSFGGNSNTSSSTENKPVQSFASFGGNSNTSSSTENKPVPSFASPFGGLQAKTASVIGTSTTTEAPGGASTPAKQFSFNTSTTPAGPPPKNGISSSSLFGNGNTTSDSKPVGENASEPKSLFGKGSSTLFGAPKPVAESNSTTSSDSLKPSPLASNSLNTTTSDAQSTEKSNTLKVPVPSEQTSSGSTSKPDPFQNPSSINTDAPTTTSSSSTPFAFPSAVGTKRGAPATASTAATSTENPSNQASDTTKKTTGEDETEKSVNALPFGSSTVGPTPQLTRLKNKTMDEIITRWASDLSKYKKEFQEQASKVAAWDRLMVENGEKIQKLYLSTFEAERQNTEIERQLLNVENQQDEVSSWLDKYESEIDEMFSRQIGQGEIVQGPDQEREKTYKLAEKLTDRLDDMGKNLTSMINAINDASTVLSKTGKADDPLSSIVRVLNNHLTTLQWIDENAEALKSKIEESQKFGKSMASNGFKGLESESADYFYRSLMGRK